MANRYTPKDQLAAIAHARTVYDYMLENSEVEDFDGQSLNVYRGSFSKLFDTIGISKTYYRVVRTILEESESVVYVRGSGRRPSTVALLRPPSASDAENIPRSDLTRGTGDATLRLVDEMAARVAAIESLVGGFPIAKALRNHENRITELEKFAGLKKNDSPM